MSTINNQKKRGQPHRTNEDINVPEVRLILDDGSQAGIVSIQEALNKAKTASLDLVEIADKSEPPVCKIMNYGKFLFEQKKKQQQQKKNQKQTQLKEIKFRPGTEEGDYQVKLRNLRRFLENGDKAKVTIRFRGREMAHKDIGEHVLERLTKDLNELASVEQSAKREGRQMFMVFAPKKK